MSKKGKKNYVQVVPRMAQLNLHEVSVLTERKQWLKKTNQ